MSDCIPSYAAAVSRATVLISLAALLALPASAAGKQFKFKLGSEGNLTVVNPAGAVHLRPSLGHDLTVQATTYSPEVEVDATQAGNRVEVRTRYRQKVSGDAARVDYEIAVPQGANVKVRALGGPVSAEGLAGDLGVEGESAEVTISGIRRGYVRVHTISGPVTLTAVQAHVEATTSSGAIVLEDVSGARVAAHTTDGAIRYTGDFGHGGDYTFTTHSGDISVSLPASASVELNARSVSGQVENDFPLQPAATTPLQAASQHAFAGTSNSGSSSVELRSFSGRIRVKKQ